MRFNSRHFISLFRFITHADLRIATIVAKYNLCVLVSPDHIRTRLGRPRLTSYGRGSAKDLAKHRLRFTMIDSPRECSQDGLTLHGGKVHFKHLHTPPLYSLAILCSVLSISAVKYEECGDYVVLI